MKPDPLREAHRELRKAVKPARRVAHANEGTLASHVREAMDLWDRMRADGTTLSDCVKALEGVLRQVWPFTREWKYLCKCDDIGLVIADCAGDATCGRSKVHLPHSFGTPCWCGLGNKFKDKPRGGGDFTAAGKTSKPTRVGRG